MRDYARISPQFWIGSTGRMIRGMGPECQVVALYLLTCPSSNMVGLFYLPLPILSHETGIPMEGASKALESLSRALFAHYDATDEVVWIPEMARHQIGDSLEPKDNRCKGVAREADQYKKTRFHKDFYEKYGAAFHLPKWSPLEAPSKPLGSQEQEQEQEQEQDSKEGAKAPVDPWDMDLEDGAGEGARVEPTAPAPKPAPLKPRKASPSEVQEWALRTWNASAVGSGMVKASGMTPARAKALAARLKEPGFPDAFTAAACYLATQDFATGKTERKWRADVDFLLKPGNAVKYADQAAAGPAAGAFKTRHGRMAAHEESVAAEGAAAFDAAPLLPSTPLAVGA